MSKKIIAVFGVTGSQGSSVLKALVNNNSYHVRALTRNANSDRAKNLLSLPNCTIFEADFNDLKSLDTAFAGCHGVFAVTDSRTTTKEKEVQQGLNAINSAIKNGVKHIVFSGLESTESAIGKPCVHFDYKAEVEKYGLKNSDKITFTSIRMPCYYESIAEMFTKKVKDNEFILKAPMDGKPMYGISAVDDTGECVLSIFENSEVYKSQLIGIAADNLTLSEYAALMTKHLQPNKFSEAKISLKEFADLSPYTKELAIMFEFYSSGKMERNIDLTRKLHKNLLSYEQWLIKNKQSLLDHFK